MLVPIILINGLLISVHVGDDHVGVFHVEFLSEGPLVCSGHPDSITSLLVHHIINLNTLQVLDVGFESLGLFKDAKVNFIAVLLKFMHQAVGTEPSLQVSILVSLVFQVCLWCLDASVFGVEGGDWCDERGLRILQIIQTVKELNTIMDLLDKVLQTVVSLESISIVGLCELSIIVKELDVECFNLRIQELSGDTVHLEAVD